MNNDKVLEELKEKRTKCIVYTRVMGYHRPVESFNIGKKGEHQERKFFTEKTAQCDVA
jgi:hypothetical protein